MYLIIDNKKIKINKINKTKGLMFKKEPITEGYILNNCNAIHTFFMKQNIDVVITDKNNNIVKIKQNLKKNKILIKIKGKTTYELPKNSTKNLKLNTKLKIVA